jgi:hypothetical protein
MGVYSYDTGAILNGIASAELVHESEVAEPTGAVPAFCDAAGVWQYVQPNQVNYYRSSLHETVITVYVIASAEC